MTSIHSRSHNIGINKFIKIGSDNKLKKFYLKGIVYQRGFDLVLHIVGKDQWHTTMFGFMMNRAGTTFMKKKSISIYHTSYTENVTKNKGKGKARQRRVTPEFTSDDDEMDEDDGSLVSPTGEISWLDNF